MNILPRMTIVFPFYFKFAFAFGSGAGSITELGMQFTCFLGEMRFEVLLQFNKDDPWLTAFYVKIDNFSFADMLEDILNCDDCLGDTVKMLLQFKVESFELSINPTGMPITIGKGTVEPGIKFDMKNFNLWDTVKIERAYLYASYGAAIPGSLGSAIPTGFELQIEAGPMDFHGLLYIGNKDGNGTKVDIKILPSEFYIKISGGISLLGGLLSAYIHLEVTLTTYYYEFIKETYGLTFKVVLEGVTPVVGAIALGLDTVNGVADGSGKTREGKHARRWREEEEKNGQFKGRRTRAEVADPDTRTCHFTERALTKPRIETKMGNCSFTAEAYCVDDPKGLLNLTITQRCSGELGNCPAREEFSCAKLKEVHTCKGFKSKISDIGSAVNGVTLSVQDGIRVQNLCPDTCEVCPGTSYRDWSHQLGAVECGDNSMMAGFNVLSCGGGNMLRNTARCLTAMMTARTTVRYSDMANVNAKATFGLNSFMKMGKVACEDDEVIQSFSFGPPPGRPNPEWATRVFQLNCVQPAVSYGYVFKKMLADPTPGFVSAARINNNTFTIHTKCRTDKDYLDNLVDFNVECPNDWVMRGFEVKKCKEESYKWILTCTGIDLIDNNPKSAANSRLPLAGINFIDMEGDRVQLRVCKGGKAKEVKPTTRITTHNLERPGLDVSLSNRAGNSGVFWLMQCENGQGMISIQKLKIECYDPGVLSKRESQREWSEEFTIGNGTSCGAGMMVGYRCKREDCSLVQVQCQEYKDWRDQPRFRVDSELVMELADFLINELAPRLKKVLEGVTKGLRDAADHLAKQQAKLDEAIAAVDRLEKALWPHRDNWRQAVKRLASLKEKLPEQEKAKTLSVGHVEYQKTHLIVVNTKKDIQLAKIKVAYTLKIWEENDNWFTGALKDIALKAAKFLVHAMKALVWIAEKALRIVAWCLEQITKGLVAIIMAIGKAAEFFEKYIFKLHHLRWGYAIYPLALTVKFDAKFMILTAEIAFKIELELNFEAIINYFVEYFKAKIIPGYTPVKPGEKPAVVCITNCKTCPVNYYQSGGKAGAGTCAPCPEGTTLPSAPTGDGLTTCTKPAADPGGSFELDMCVTSDTCEVPEASVFEGRRRGLFEDRRKGPATHPFYIANNYDVSFSPELEELLSSVTRESERQGTPIETDSDATMFDNLASAIGTRVRSRGISVPSMTESYAQSYFSRKAASIREEQSAGDIVSNVYDANFGLGALCDVVEERRAPASRSRRMGDEEILLDWDGFQQIRVTDSTRRRDNGFTELPACTFTTNPDLRMISLRGRVAGEVPELPIDNSLKSFVVTNARLRGSWDTLLRRGTHLQSFHVQDNYLTGSIGRTVWSPSLTSISIVDNQVQVDPAALFDSLQSLSRLRQVYWDRNTQVVNEDFKQPIRRHRGGLSSAASRVQPEISVLYGAVTIEGVHEQICGQCGATAHPFHCFEMECADSVALTELEISLEDALRGLGYFDEVYIDSLKWDGEVAFSARTPFLDLATQRDILEGANQAIRGQISPLVELQFGCTAGAIGQQCEYICPVGWTRRDVEGKSPWPQCVVPSYCDVKCSNHLLSTMRVCSNALYDRTSEWECKMAMMDSQQICGRCRFFNGQANDYEGFVSKTLGVKKCRKWNQVSSFIQPDRRNWDHNFCRNHEGSGNTDAWCFTTESGDEWDYCNIGNPSKPRCHDEGTSCAEIALQQFHEIFR